MLLSAVTAFNQRITTQVRQSLRLTSMLTHKPKILWHWLVSARFAQFFILALVVLLPLVILPGLDLLLSKIFTPVTRNMLFGIIHTTEDNPHLATAQDLVHWLLWSGATLLALYLYLRHLPVAVDSASQIAREKEQRADQLVNSNPSESILLYDAARSWICDDESESKIRAKLDALNARMSQDNGVGSMMTADTGTNGTMILATQAQQSEERKALIADRYQVKQQLGAGAMGIVYQAEDRKLNRDVALKQLAPSLASDAQLLARFRQEAQALARLSHPHIVQVYDFIEWQHLYLIVMEFVAGDELENWLRQRGALAISDAVNMAIQMAQALGYAHERGVVHRDFKPANVLITHQGDIKITDFGIAKLARSSVHTQVNMVMGSPAYMSPEQASGEATDQRTDIYALGVVLYQLLCGERPFDGDTQSIIAQHLTNSPARPSSLRDEIPSALDELVLTMLAKQPDDRHQSMAEVIAQLRQCQA